MTIENLDRVFSPGSVAVIRASDRPGSMGAAVMQNLVSGEFAGDIIPVNPRHASVMGIGACTDARDMDLAVVAEHIKQVPGAW